MAGLPNDHYHAFLDPIVVILIAVPAAGLFARALAIWRADHHPGAALAGFAIGAGLAVLVAVALVRKPPPVDPDGGWPAMQAAGTRIVAWAAGKPMLVLGLPDFKLADAIRFPIAHAGGQLGQYVDIMGFPEGIDVIVVACDRLFEAAIGQPCGGPAEDAYVAKLTTIGSRPGHRAAIAQ